MHRITCCLMGLLSLGLPYGSSLTCGKGSFEVQDIKGAMVACDKCNKSLFLTPCATVKCTADTECKAFQMKLDPKESCDDTKFPLQAKCVPKCTKNLQCKTGSILAERIGGCQYCYKPESKDYVNPERDWESH